MEDDEMFERAAVFYSSCPIKRRCSQGAYDAELERLQALLIDVHNAAIDEAIEVVRRGLSTQVIEDLKLRTRE